MKIKKIKIHNFKSIRDLEMLSENLVILIGANNSGKSNILKAVEYCLTPGYKPSSEEYFTFREEDYDIYVELTFSDLSEQEQTTFSRYIRNDGTICIRKTSSLLGEKSEVSYNGYVNEPDIDWLKKENIADLTTREKIAGTPLNSLVPDSGRLTKSIIEAAQENYIEQHRDEIIFIERLEKTPLLGAKNIGGGALPDFYLVPAVRDLSDETKIKNTTVFGKLLSRAIQVMAESDPKFQNVKVHLSELLEAFNATTKDDRSSRPMQLQTLEKEIEQELSSWDVGVKIEIKPPDLEKIFELGTNIFLNDGHDSLAETKGHGLQRALIFGLIRAWARAIRMVEKSEDSEISPRKASESLVFAIEEPELYLHPQAQRRLSKSLSDISKLSDHQVLMSSHSPHFIDLVHHKSIIITLKGSSFIGTKITQVHEDIFDNEDLASRKKRFHAAHWINPDRGEMFFAKKTVFVEGETEKAILPFLGEKLGVINQDISIIDCGSKYNLPLYIEVANAFKINYLVIHDEDPLPDPIPKEWNDDKVKEKERCFNLNSKIKQMVGERLGKIEVLKPDIEGVLSVSKSQGERKGKALAAIEHFQDKNVQDIPQNIINLVNKVYL